MEFVGAGLILVSSGIILWSIISWDLEQAKKEREYQEKLNQDLNEAIGSISKKNQELRKNQEHCDPEDTVDGGIQDLQDKSREHCDPNESWSDSYRRDV